MQENRISIKISATELQTVLTAIKTINSILGPRLMTLSKEERKTLPKMSDGSLPFVQKALEYCKTNSQFVPGYIDVTELQIDVDAVATLLQIQHPLDQLTQTLDDTVMLCGSEALTAALGFYCNVKQAKKMKVPGAETIFKDLFTRFAKLGKKKNSEGEAGKLP